MSLTPLQRFTYREIARAAIVNAPYNPRKLSAYARKKLRAQLADGGLVEALVWNERTGHLVSGHKRLELLDDLEGGRDYTVGVAVVQLSDADERAQNVFFNNIYAQGTYDETLFVENVQAGARLEAMGFTIADLEQEFGLVPALDPTFATTAEARGPIVDQIREVEKARTLRDVDHKIAALNQVEGYNDSDYTLAIVFPTPEDRDAFAIRYGVDDAFRLTADQLIALFDERYRWRLEVPHEPDTPTDVPVSGDSPEPDHAGAVQPADDLDGRGAAAA